MEDGRQTDRERERVAYSPLYTYIEKFQRLCSDPGNWSASIHDRDWCGECNFLRPRRRRLSFDAPFPYDPPPPPPSRANSRICINTIGFRRGNSSKGVEGRGLSWRKCAGNPIILYPPQAFGSSILIRKERLLPAENNSEEEGGEG